MKHTHSSRSRQDSDPSSSRNAAHTTGSSEPPAPSESHSLSRYQRFLNAIDNPAFIADTQSGAILAANSNACRLLGRSLDALVGQDQTTLFPEDDRSRYTALFRQCALAAADERPPSAQALHLVCANGHVQPCEVSGFSFEEPTGHICCAIFRARHAPSLTEQALRESERRFRLLVENSPDAFFLHDMGGNIVDVNQRACAMLGYTAKELLAMRIDAIEVACPPETLHALWREMRPGPFSFDGLGKRKDGSTFPSEIRGVAFNERDRILALVSVRDVTARKELEEHLEAARDQALAANRTKTEFLANASHEIRTPLNILLGMADLLRETQLNDRQRQYVDSIENAGTLLLRLINDILDLSRIEADRTNLILEDIDPGEVLRTIAAAVRIPVEQKGLSFGLVLDENLPSHLQTDPTRLQQVLMNLLWNAIKFTTHGSIVLAAKQGMDEAGGASLRIEVRDTGIGIAPEQQQRIFDPFTQADASSQREYGGAGLGLTICKRLVLLLGGAIGVQSEPGRGSCFFFTLPLPNGTVAPAPAHHTDSTPSAGSAATHRILLVEDSPANQILVQLFLENEPYELVMADSGMAALAHFADQSFDLVLMDVELPGMDGLETTAALRRMERERALPRTPIVVVTAHAFAKYEQQGRQAGCDSFLAKPLRKHRLITELARFFRTET